MPQAADIKKALKRQGHSAKTPWNHFENFDRGLDAAVALTATMIANECSAEWNEFNVSTSNPSESGLQLVAHPLPRAALLLILAVQAKFGVPLNTRVFPRLAEVEVLWLT